MSEIGIQKIVQVLQNIFLDSWSDGLGKDKLYNVASGFAIPNLEVSTMILNPVNPRLNHIIFWKDLHKKTISSLL